VRPEALIAAAATDGVTLRLSSAGAEAEQSRWHTQLRQKKAACWKHGDATRVKRQTLHPAG